MEFFGGWVGTALLETTQIHAVLANKCFHPDVVKFRESLQKRQEEKKMWVNILEMIRGK